MRREKSLQQQPLGDEAIERRQARDGEAPTNVEPRDPRHAVNEPAEPAEVALARGVQYRARAEEQQALHERMIDGVIEHGDQRQRRQRRHAHAAKDDGEPDAGEQDADVLDGRERQQAFHVGLRGREHHAVDRGEQAERERDESPPPDRVV